MLNAPDEVIREVLALEQAQETLSIRARAQDDFMVFMMASLRGLITSR